MYIQYRVVQKITLETIESFVFNSICSGLNLDPVWLYRYILILFLNLRVSMFSLGLGQPTRDMTLEQRYMDVNTTVKR